MGRGLSGFRRAKAGHWWGGFLTSTIREPPSQHAGSEAFVDEMTTLSDERGVGMRQRRNKGFHGTRGGRPQRTRRD